MRNSNLPWLSFAYKWLALRRAVSGYVWYCELRLMVLSGLHPNWCRIKIKRSVLRLPPPIVVNEDITCLSSILRLGTGLARKGPIGVVLVNVMSLVRSFESTVLMLIIHKTKYLLCNRWRWLLRIPGFCLCSSHQILDLCHCSKWNSFNDDFKMIPSRSVLHMH